MNKPLHLCGFTKEIIIASCSFMIGVIYLLFVFQIQLNIIFPLSVLIIYLIMLPKKLMNPKNFVFFFYFIWYGIAPFYGTRYKDVYSIYGGNVDFAYLLCFTTYVVSMLTLHLVSFTKNTIYIFSNYTLNWHRRNI